MIYRMIRKDDGSHHVEVEDHTGVLFTAPANDHHAAQKLVMHALDHGHESVRPEPKQSKPKGKPKGKQDGSHA